VKINTNTTILISKQEFLRITKLFAIFTKQFFCVHLSFKVMSNKHFYREMETGS